MRKAAGTITVVLGLAFFISGGFLLDRSARFAPLQYYLHNPSIPPGMLEQGKMGKIMARLKMIKAVPNDFSRFSLTKQTKRARLFLKKRWTGAYLYTINANWLKNAARERQHQTITTQKQPANRAIGPRNFIKGWPLISITVDHDALYDLKRGIIPNYNGRGRQWERQAHVAYYDNRKRLFASTVGLRLHGGMSRKEGRNFRLYFRSQYGAEEFKSGLLFPPEIRLKRLVVRQTNFNDPLALDFARAIGCKAPRTRLALFALNGKHKGIYLLSEHLSRKQWEVSHFKHKNFLFYRYKGVCELETYQRYNQMRDWAKDPSGENDDARGCPAYRC